MTKLSDFLVDMRDSERVVGVTEKQLREYAIQAKAWSDLAEIQQEKMKQLECMVTYLKDKIKELECNQIELIDLRA